MSRKDKWNIIKRKHLCAYCFVKHREKCNKICGKNNCEKYHNPILHVELVPPQNEISAQINFHSNNQVEDILSVLLRIVPVKLIHNNESIKTYALLDEESSISLLDDEIAQHLKLTGPVSDL